MSPQFGPISRAILAVNIALALALLLPLVALGQKPGTSLSGAVKSASGSQIPNAQLSVKNLSSGETSALVANPEGAFVLTNLAPGTYEIITSAPGFAATKMQITILEGQDKTVKITLQAETRAADKGQAGTSGVSGVVSSKSLADLPLNGRSASDLATLEPGVASARTQSSGQAQRGFGNQMTISGGRPRQNDSRLDGISVNDYANGPPASALGVNLGADAVEQFSVLTSNYPAQYGRSSGGIIAASTRSGTSSFHGSAFEYLRNSAFDARNFFDNAKPAFHRNQFGVTAGGPILKGRTFFFADYEGLRQSQGLTQVATVPSPAARAGNLSTGNVNVDSFVLRFINAFYPLPNGPLLGAGDTGIFTFAGPTVTPENYFTAKLD
ncbi:MAG TPA: carboxypeptidase regulatory-like domain-containing protein, partial [Terriglobales bacterium]|nr:carboxypeptidase regulatory-like domain-containing protein [Terriglobales bacterium]